MVTAGCTKCVEDVHKIMGKLIKKDIQLQYSGCGKIIKGFGKYPFNATDTFKLIESKCIIYRNTIYDLTSVVIIIEFLTAKYVGSKEKPILTAVSNYLSGAKDREGGRAKRNKEILFED